VCQGAEYLQFDQSLQLATLLAEHCDVVLDANIAQIPIPIFNRQRRPWASPVYGRLFLLKNFSRCTTKSECSSPASRGLFRHLSEMIITVAARRRHGQEVLKEMVRHIVLTHYLVTSLIEQHIDVSDGSTEPYSVYAIHILRLRAS
jgi:hypothetical protein